MHNFKEGDYFKWWFKDEYSKGDQTLLYWCKSRIARYSGGKLKDTYWGDCSSNNYELDTGMVEIQFLGNINDYIRISESDAKYYGKENLLDLSHANNRIQDNLYVRTDAARSKIKMMGELESRIQGAKYDLHSAERQLNWLENQKDALENATSQKELDCFYF